MRRADVAVDKETGAIRLKRYTVIQDAGKAVHPSYVEGQFQGGATQGIGWALNEEYVYGADGRLQNPIFLDYRIPVASDLPNIETVILEIPNPGHPYGVRGVGEGRGRGCGVDEGAGAVDDQIDPIARSGEISAG